MYFYLMKGISPSYFEGYPWLQKDCIKIPHLLVVLCGSKKYPYHPYERDRIYQGA